MRNLLRNDEQLVSLVRLGDDRAFEAIVARYRGPLLAFCRHMLRSREDAEDALQEVFTSAHRALRADDRPVALRPWLYRVARNRCLNQMRRREHLGMDSMDEFVRVGGEADEAVERRESLRELVEDLRALPERQRAAILMREVGGLGWVEIGQALDATIPSVKSLLVRARVNLAEARMEREQAVAAAGAARPVRPAGKTAAAVAA